MFSVLILEDEAMLRGTMVRALQRLPGLDVREAGTVTEAVAAIDKAPPDLILSDIDLPDRSGVEMLGELGARRLPTPLVFISAYLKAYGSQIPPNARVEVREKPVAVEDLRALVQKHMAERAPHAGAETPFGVPDYLQIACMGRHSVLMEVRLPGGGAGRIMVVRGELHHAEDPLGKGAPAFQRLVMVRAATVSCRTLHEEPGPRTITQPWEGLMLDAARALDEAERDGDPLPDFEPAVVPDAASATAPEHAHPAVPHPAVPHPAVPHPAVTAAPAPVALAPPRPSAPPAPPVPAPPPPPPARTFSDAFDEGVDALLRRDHARAYALFMEAESLQPGEPRVKANLVRLRAMGHGGAA